MIDIALAIERLVPNAEYAGSTTGSTRDVFDALRWTDARPKPSWGQIVGAWNMLRETPPAPDEITNFQARALLMQMASPFRQTEEDERTMFHDADDYCRAAGGAVWQAWEYANVFLRKGLLVQTMKGLWGLSDAQIDSMFAAAARIEP
jgi:hypothetical protein